MIDKNTLIEMSQDVLVIPFTEETADVLDKFCRTQIKNITLDRLEELILAFLTRQNDDNLDCSLLAFVKEEGLSNDIMPRAILPVLAEYIVLLAIEECESSEKKALYSLALKDAIILAVKGEGFVATPKAVSDCYDLYYGFLMDEKVYCQEKDDNDALQELLDSGSFSEKIKETEEETLKAMVYDAALYRYNNFIGGLHVETDNLIKSVYLMVKKIVDEAPWRYADVETAITIKKVIGKACETVITLSNVKSVLKDQIESDGSGFRLSSILLRLINDEDGVSLPDNISFTVIELAVYIYYELLFEVLSREQVE